MRRAGPGFVANEECVNRYQKMFLRASAPDLVHKKAPCIARGRVMGTSPFCMVWSTPDVVPSRRLGLFVPLVSLVMDEFRHSIKGSKTEPRRLHPLLLLDADGPAIDWTLQGRPQDGEKLPPLICEDDGSRS